MFLAKIIQQIMVYAVLRGGVNPSMNPSRVQLRRYAILGYAHHSTPKYSLIIYMVWVIAVAVMLMPIKSGLCLFSSKSC